MSRDFLAKHNQNFLWGPLLFLSQLHLFDLLQLTKTWNTVIWKNYGKLNFTGDHTIASCPWCMTVSKTREQHPCSPFCQFLFVHGECRAVTHSTGPEPHSWIDTVHFITKGSRKINVVYLVIFKNSAWLIVTKKQDNNFLRKLIF